jgi:hypothetical protein
MASDESTRPIRDQAVSARSGVLGLLVFRETLGSSGREPRQPGRTATSGPALADSRMAMDDDASRVDFPGDSFSALLR